MHKHLLAQHINNNKLNIFAHVCDVQYFLDIENSNHLFKDNSFREVLEKILKNEM